jgi:Ca-activated chloride channel family protein
MTFLWPELLWLLLAVPVLVALYFALLKRKKRLALRYASLGMISRAMGPAQKLRRHLPPLVFLIALIMLIVAVARPSATLTLPARYETIVLAIDISGSMRASDVKPNRIAAAQEAARKFIADQPSSARIGLVSFAATASVLQPPTRDRESILAAIDRLQLQRGTAIGSGILVALKTIFPDVEFDLRANNPRGETKPSPLDSSTAKQAPEKAEPGSYNSAAIILLTDGQTTSGPNPIEAARIAAERGVRVFTVGIGTTQGQILGSEGWSMRVKLDEEALKNIAQVTRAEYFFADNAVDLKKIYESLNARISLETKQTEITALLAAAAAALSLVSAFLSVLWFNRIL